MRWAAGFVVAGACWSGAPNAALPAPKSDVAARMFAGHVELAWDGELLVQAPGFPARFDRAGTELVPGREFALVGCVGLIGRARLTTPDALGWRFELIARAALWSPSRTCPTGERLHAFAVSPPERVRDGERGEADVESVYATLPLRFRGWHEAADTDHELALWADIDADRAIDLVELSGPCEPDDDAACTAILSRDQTRWRRIGGSLARDPF